MFPEEETEIHQALDRLRAIEKASQGQRLLLGGTDPGGWVCRQIPLVAGHLYHGFGSRRMRLYQPLHSEPDGSFSVNLPTAPVHRAPAPTTTRGQSGFGPWEGRLVNTLHTLQRHGHSLHNTGASKTKCAQGERKVLAPAESLDIPASTKQCCLLIQTQPRWVTWDEVCDRCHQPSAPQAWYSL